MVDEFMVCVDRLIQSGCCEPGNGAAVAAANGGGLVEARRGLGVAGGGCGLPMEGGCGEEGSSNTVPLMKERVGGLIGGSIECRICQEEGEEGDMESPCACNGTLKFAHRKCIQKWCNKKGDITCEICNQVYAPNYSAPPTRINSDGLAIDISWGQQMDLHAALASAEHELLRAEYEDYATAHNNGIACCRAVALILMFLLLIRHALMVTRDSRMVEDASTFFNVSLLQLAVIVLPCYIIVRSCYIMQCRRRRQAYLRQIWG